MFVFLLCTSMSSIRFLSCSVEHNLTCNRHPISGRLDSQINTLVPSIFISYKNDWPSIVISETEMKEGHQLRLRGWQADLILQWIPYTLHFWMLGNTCHAQKILVFPRQKMGVTELPYFYITITYTIIHRQHMFLSYSIHRKCR